MVQKSNKYLDISDEDEDPRISDSEFLEEGKFTHIQQSTRKRRKLNPTDGDSSDSQAEEEEDDHEGADDNQQNDAANTTAKTSEKHRLKNKRNTTAAAITTTPHLKLSTAHQRKKRKTGVIYLSKIPPFMKPSALRHLLAPHGTLLRIFLTPEPSPSYTRRIKAGGNKKRSFVDGWVEFASKKRAKVCAETLNGNIIGGRKGGWYHDDIWNVKYLRGFKWDDLMEQVQDEERVRKGRLQVEIQQEARERRAFVENVERVNMERTREGKRRRRLDEGVVVQGMDDGDVRPLWTQNKVKGEEKRVVVDSPDDVVRVPSKIF